MTTFFKQSSLAIFPDVVIGIRKDVRSFRCGGKWFPLEGTTFADVLDYSSPSDICKACGIVWNSPESSSLLASFMSEGVTTTTDYTFQSYDRGETYYTKIPAGTRIYRRSAGNAHTTATAWMVRPDRKYGIKA